MTFDGALVLATRNKGKISEFKSLFTDFNIEIKSLKDFRPIPPVLEDGETFEDNAVKKACFTARAIGLPALADDSGLVVKALGGMPGVLSARYAGDNATDEEKNIKLLGEMGGVIDREAKFICIISIAVPMGSSLIYKGTCEGIIAQKSTGRQGFGYDPIFYYPDLKKTFAQMSSEEKNRVSHRGRAMVELHRDFDKVLIWLRQRL